MVRTLKIRCGDCGQRLKEYELIADDGTVEGTEEVCPNQWRENHP